MLRETLVQTLNGAELERKKTPARDEMTPLEVFYLISALGGEQNLPQNTQLCSKNNT